MTLAEQVPLSALTTFKTGGTARYVAECRSAEDIAEALAYAREHALPWYVLGEGSNVLAPDDGYAGVILRIRIEGLSFAEEDERMLATAGAGVSWDTLVAAAAERGFWGIENLAGIPGTCGAAPVQNIGAYGSELADTLVSVDVFDTESGETRTLSREDCAFGYRDSRFKRSTALIILRITLALRKDGAPQLAYKDLAAAKDAGVPLATPGDVGAAVREIRSRKFPPLAEYGTAGSFFKNPVVAADACAALLERYPGMPAYLADGGIKLSTAWFLDNVLSLRGYRSGHTWLYERQPLVIVAEAGASSSEVDALAREVEARMRETTGITLEREVRMMPTM